MGMSDLAEIAEPRSGQQVVDDLHALLEAARIEGPYVLVGHSLGGAITRLYADDYREDVVGMVLVDASHEDVPRIREEILGAEVYEEHMLAVNRVILEDVDYPGILEETRATRDLGDMPLVVLTAGSTDVYEPFTDETARQEHEAWVNILQPALAALSSNSTHIIVEESGHMIPLYSPQSVVDAVRMVVDEVRGGP
jgi:pimeloyl-ACP methyl ester carboxylesterase